MSASELGESVNTWVHKRWWVPVLEGVCLALFGILLLIFSGANSNQPLGMLVFLFVVLAFFLIAHGAVTFFGALLDKGSPDRVWGMVFGVVTVLLGIVALILPKTSLAVFCWLLIIFLLISGVLAIARAIAWRRIPGSGWGWTLAFGILAVLLALYCVVFPIAGAAAIAFALVFWIGFLAVILGAVLIYAGVRVKQMTARLAALR